MQPSEVLKALFGTQPFFSGITRGEQTNHHRSLLLTAIASLAAAPGKPIRVLEIGSWLGFSALTWAYAIERFSGAGEILCVDFWSRYFDAKETSINEYYADMDRLAASGMAYELFKHNTGTGPSSVPIRHRRGQSQAILAELAGTSYDIVYVDASHYYKDVLADLQAARGLVAEGGILCGDDLEAQCTPEHEAVLRANVDREKVTLSSGIRCHPGVTLAVYDVLGPVSMMAGTWFMRRNGDRFLPIGDELYAGKMTIPPHWPQDMKDKALRVLERAPAG